MIVMESSKHSTHSKWFYNSTNETIVLTLIQNLSTDINSSFVSEVNFSIIDKELIHGVIVLLLYLITTIVALIGNILVCKVIFMTKKMRNITYVLMLNMAISDIIGALTIPGQWVFCASYFLNESAIVAERLCATTKSIQIQSYYVSTFTMTVIAIDRFRMVKYPLKKRIKPLIPIVIIWLSGAAFTATTTFSMRVSDYWGSKALIGCRIVLKLQESSFNFQFRKIRVALLILTQYLVPLSITGILYFFICKTIWNRNIGEMTATQMFHQTNCKRRTIKMLVIVVIAFTLSWLPVHTIHFTDFYVTPLFPTACNSSLVYMLFYWLAINSCSLNPFIYCWLNKDFRDAAKCVFCCVPCITTIRYNTFSKRSSSGQTDTNNSNNSSTNRKQCIFYITAEKQVNLTV